MSRRTAAGLLAIALVVVFVAWGSTKPVDYATFRPGPTFNVLGKLDGKQILTISGRRTYPDDGALRMVTVYQSGFNDRLSLIGMLSDWIDPNVSLIPRDVVFPKDSTAKTVQQQSTEEMTSSQDAATAAALNALRIPFTKTVEEEVRISTVGKGTPAAGVLRVGDVLLGVGGKRLEGPKALVNAIRSAKPGSTVEIMVDRGGKVRTFSLKTIAATDDARASRIGVGISDDKVAHYSFPFTVKINVGSNVGGPSAGMMFALSIYDLLTPGSLTGGNAIAGSGEISPDGVVGPIGGIGQKIVGAQRDGARLFLVAKENCEEAASAHYDHGKIRLVEVHTLADAINAVNLWRENPQATLTGCGS